MKAPRKAGILIINQAFYGIIVTIVLEINLRHNYNLMEIGPVNFEQEFGI